MVYATNESSSQSQHQTTDGSSTKSLKSARRLRLSQNEMLQVWHLYTQTDTKVDDIAKMFNISHPCIYDYLDRVGLPYKRRGQSFTRLSSKQIQRIKTLKKSGHKRRVHRGSSRLLVIDGLSSLVRSPSCRHEQAVNSSSCRLPAAPSDRAAHPDGRAQAQPDAADPSLLWWLR